MNSYLLAIDQGTTGSRAILYDSKGIKRSSAYHEITQYYPQPGWVEHDAEELWQSVQRVIQKSLQNLSSKQHQIAGIALTNQRETVVCWDAVSGKAAYHALVWQDRRTSDICQRFKKKYSEERLRLKTGLVFDPYFSASKIYWLLNNVPSIKRLAKNTRLRIGTVDSWILWKLTRGVSHATDFTNASRTMLFNLQTRMWDRELLNLFGVKADFLPRTLPSCSIFGHTKGLSVLPDNIPIHTIMGDQQSALYGQSCYSPGFVKNTYGTGCFVMFNAGKKYQKPNNGILLTLASDFSGQPCYALEGSIFIAGAAIQWLRDELKFFSSASQTEAMIRNLSSSGGVTVIPAFVGMGSPYWNPDVRGCISGITRGTKPEHLIRATLESVAHQSMDVIETMRGNSHQHLTRLRVDGGMTQNSFLMQFQADLLQHPVEVSNDSDLTSWGVAKLAGRQMNFWKSEKLIENRHAYKVFRPRLKPTKVRELRRHWKQEITRLISSTNS